jgi:NTE family protein
MKPSIRTRLKSRMGTALVVPAPATVPVKRPPKIGLALGGGGARGLAHILMLEVFDELGIKPSFIVGTSIGAVYGAAYASGLSAKYIRAHTEEVLSQRLGLVRQLVGARAAPISRLIGILPVRAGMLDPVAVLDLVLPPRMPTDFERLAIPLAVVATDFHTQEAVLLNRGRLKSAVAASMALPALFAPVTFEGRTLLDGGLVNPLPFDLLTSEADITVAIDVSGGAREETSGGPGAFGALLASTQIMQRSIVREKLKSVQPDVYIDSTVEHFHMVEFHKFREILKSAAPAKEALKRQLDRVMKAETVAPLVPVAKEAPPEKVAKGARSLLRRGRRTPPK